MWSTAGFADCFRYRGAFEGCISGHDSDFSHRPYHKNCRCALHDTSRRLPGVPMSPFPAARCNSVSFPVRRSQREGSLALVVASSEGPTTTDLAAARCLFPAASLGGELPGSKGGA